MAHRGTLNLPVVEREEFSQNLIVTAVCELRFPTLLEYETKAPAALQKTLRREYPHYEREESVSLRPGRVENETKYIFRARRGDWLVAFKPSSIALETTRYTNFDEFAERFSKLLSKCKSFIDSDFFTRVGLRYLNSIPIEGRDLSGWIRNELIAAIPTYGDVDKYLQEVRGRTDIGRYTFRHGISEKTPDRIVYNLDFDLSSEDVEISEVPTRVAQFNTVIYEFFMWAIGPRTRELLGEPLAKR